MIGALRVVVALHIGDAGTRGGLETEGGSRGRHCGGVLRFVAFILGGLVLVFGDQIVDAFLELHDE